jgi:hypothetical protein
MKLYNLYFGQVYLQTERLQKLFTERKALYHPLNFILEI